MFFIKRAFIYIKRRKSKSLMLGLILLVVSTLTLISLVINSASDLAFEYARLNLESNVSYRAHLSRDGLRGQGMGQVFPVDFTNINLDEINNIVDNSPYEVVDSFNINLRVRPSAFDEFLIDDFDSTRGGTMQTATMVLSNLNDNVQLNITKGNFEKLSDGEIIIEETIAELNNFDIGDTIKIETLTRSSEPDEGVVVDEHDFNIVGIYVTDDKTDLSSAEFLSNFNLGENVMYVTNEKALELNEGFVTNVVFDILDPDDTDAFSTYLENLDTPYREVNNSNDTYEKMIGPIENISATSSGILIVVIVAGGFILGLLSLLSVKDRKYEIGILLSLGEGKIKIISQMILEILIVSIASFSLAIIFSVMSSQAATNYLLNNSSLEEEANVQTGIGRFRNPLVEQVEVIDSLTVSVSAQDTGDMILVGILIIVIGNVAAASYILRADPKEIMLERWYYDYD